MLLLPGNLFLALGVGGHQLLQINLLPLNSDGAKCAMLWCRCCGTCS